jgi:AraC-like DNA-binding protein
MTKMKRIPNPEKQLAYLAYVNRENEFQHHGYEEELKQYLMMQSGDPAAVEESQRMMRKTMEVGLSADPLRNAQYLFVANITLATRFAIEGGLDSETAYNTSDMYIRKLDQCLTDEEVMDLHREMYSFFVTKMAAKRKENAFTRAVAEGIEYIETNLHMPIRIEEVAEHVNLSAGYYSVLFRKETGETFSDYVLRRRIETARNMLRYSDYSSTEISEILAFSSQSYFISCFKKATKMTPSEYRRRYYAKGMKAAGKAAEKQPEALQDSDWRRGEMK